MLFPTFRFLFVYAQRFQGAETIPKTRIAKKRKKTMGASANPPQMERELPARGRLSGESYVLLKAERDKQVALGNNFGRVRAEKFLASYGPAHQYGKQAISTALECIQEGKAYKVAEGRGPKKTKANPKVQQMI